MAGLHLLKINPSDADVPLGTRALLSISADEDNPYVKYGDGSFAKIALQSYVDNIFGGLIGQFTPFGLSLVGASDAASARDILELGSAALANSDAFDTAGSAISAEASANAYTDAAKLESNAYTDEQVANYVPLTQKGAALGVAELDAGGKVPVAQLPSSLMEYKGAWDASTNTPTLADGVGDNGDCYRCSAAGTVNFGSGPITFAVGDFCIYNGSVWQHSPAVDAVVSVFGRAGAVTAQSGDYTFAQIGTTPTTLAGYGVSDAYTKTETDSGFASLSGSYSNPSWITALDWAKISGTPTTLAGYGITDPIVLTSGSYSNPSWITSLAWSKLSGTPTTLSGYGITDAAVDASVVHLAGAETISGIKTFSVGLTIISATKVAVNADTFNGTAYTPALQQNGSTAGVATLNALFSATSSGPRIAFLKSRNTTVGSHTSVASSDRLGTLEWMADDGTSYGSVASIRVTAVGTISAGVVPTQMSMFVTSSAGVATEGIRINAAGVAIALTRQLIGNTADNGVDALQVTGTVNATAAITSAGAIVSTANGALATPALKFGANGHGFYQVNSTTIGVSIGGSSTALSISTAGIFGPSAGARSSGTSGSPWSTTFTQKLNVSSPTVPSSATAVGTAGDVAWDATYFYWCSATNTWNRVARDVTWI